MNGRNTASGIVGRGRDGQIDNLAGKRAGRDFELRQ